ncbi:N-acetyltransferase family protein [Pseudarthrobacter sp. N5]|uniref:GNAT family N-acetyltransferase n=1 Tax=Pseudarthrobacter sp. N5 TaxID=3418416 RepID=UPI003CEED426
MILAGSADGLAAETGGEAGLLSVRPARPDDAQALAQVHTACWQETYKGILSDSFLAALDPAQRLGMWQRIASGPRISDHWVACDGGAAVGFAGRQYPGAEGQLPLPVRPVMLWGLYLLESHQGLGLGRRLLEAALGEEPASLWVAARNVRAVEFYRHFGFAADGAEEVMVEWEDLREVRMLR